MKVLLVEDHPTMRLGLRAAVELREGTEVAGEAAAAEEALELARTLTPDLVVLDLRLRGEPDGIELCREIKSLPDPPQVVIYTAYNSPQAISSCLLSGADSYVHKGEEPRKLLNAIEDTNAGERVWLLGGEEEEASTDLRSAAAASSLTDREQEVLYLVLKRRTNARIAGELHITVPTVKTHVSNILRKLDARNREDLF
ncbi:MAG: response regulator transcription factor [Rubrobacter sp.]|nr:response regulator transcription factor [Rubrobacter sp.]